VLLKYQCYFIQTQNVIPLLCSKFISFQIFLPSPQIGAYFHFIPVIADFGQCGASRERLFCLLYLRNLSVISFCISMHIERCVHNSLPWTRVFVCVNRLPLRRLLFEIIKAMIINKLSRSYGNKMTANLVRCNTFDSVGIHLTSR